MTNPSLQRRFSIFLTAAIAVFAAAATAFGPQDAAADDPNGAIDAYRDRMIRQAQERSAAARQTSLRDESNLSPSVAAVIRPVEPQSNLPERRALLAEPLTTSQPSPADILLEIPDPADVDRILGERYDRVVKSEPRDKRILNNYRRVHEKTRTYIAKLSRGKKVNLTLSECLQRTLASNYSIRFDAFGPAISQTQLVQAEAAFDSVFFLDASSSRTDRKGATIDAEDPQVDGRSYAGGIRKLLPTGMTVETSLGQNFNKAKVDEKQRTVYNPAYDTTFAVQFNQPLLRGFGLDYNRSIINARRLDVKINREQFLISARDRLFEAERAYWQLSNARRVVMILAETTGQNGVTYENTEARKSNDATPIEINNAKSRWQTAEVDFLRAVKAVRDAEDALKNLMNDAEFLLSRDIEIVPTETPFVMPMTVDQFAEVRAAIDERSEIKQARMAIEQARINTARAKNETMPRLDLSFRYEVQGLRGSADSSFDLMTSNRYNSYAVSVALEVPIGNRQRMAALNEAELLEKQSIVRLQQVMDGVVQEVNNSVRDLVINYETIPTQYGSVISADLSLRAFQERIERVDPNTLQTELGQIENLGNARARLAQLAADYSIAIAALERSKGTLLRYNNIVIAEEKRR